MLVESFLSLIFLSTLILSGFLYSAVFKFGSITNYRIGFSITIGFVLFVLIYSMVSFLNPWLIVFIELALTALIYLISRNYGIGINSSALTFEMSKEELYSLLIVVTPFIVFLSLTIGNDELNHFNFASQIKAGAFPPSVYGFGDLPAKYHYGWGVILAGLSNVSGLSLPLASDYLTVILLISSLFLLLAVFSRIGISGRNIVVGSFLFFFGSGIFFVATFVVTQDISVRSLSLFRLLHQHPWMFGLPIYLIIICNINDMLECKKGERNISLYAFIPIAIAIPIVNSTSAVFLIFACGIGYLLIIKKNIGNIVSFCVVPFYLLAIVIATSWPIVGGMFQFGESYDSPVAKLAVSVFSITDYIKYQFSYLILLSPIGFLTWIGVLWYFIKYRNEALENSPVIILLMLSVLLFFPLPIILTVQNAAVWDNYCKLNMFGVLSGWLLLIYVIENRDSFGIKHRYKQAILYLIYGVIILSIIEIAFSIKTVAKTDSHQAYNERKTSIEDLIAAMNYHVPIKSKILVINKDLNGMYDVDDVTNKPNVNLYKYIGDNYNIFSAAVKETGHNIINFYDYNFHYNRELEDKLWEAVNSTYSGLYEGVTDYGIDYILVVNENKPEFMNDWERKKLIMLIDKGDKSYLWEIYKTNIDNM